SPYTSLVRSSVSRYTIKKQPSRWVNPPWVISSTVSLRPSCSMVPLMVIRYFSSICISLPVLVGRRPAVLFNGDLLHRAAAVPAQEQGLQLGKALGGIADVKLHAAAAGAVVFQLQCVQGVVQRVGGGLAGVDQRHLRAHKFADQPLQQRVVGAA